MINSGNLSFTKISYSILNTPLVKNFAPFSDSAANFTGIKTICGPKNYLITENYSFVTIIPPSSGNLYTDNWSIQV